MDGHDLLMEFSFHRRNVNVERLAPSLVELWPELPICSGLGGENAFQFYFVSKESVIHVRFLSVSLILSLVLMQMSCYLLQGLLNNSSSIVVIYDIM